MAHQHTDIIAIAQRRTTFIESSVSPAAGEISAK